MQKITEFAQGVIKRKAQGHGVENGHAVVLAHPRLSEGRHSCGQDRQQPRNDARNAEFLNVAGLPEGFAHLGPGNQLDGKTETLGEPRYPVEQTFHSPAALGRFLLAIFQDQRVRPVLNDQLLDILNAAVFVVWLGLLNAPVDKFLRPFQDGKTKPAAGEVYGEYPLDPFLSHAPVGRLESLLIFRSCARRPQSCGVCDTCEAGFGLSFLLCRRQPGKCRRRGR